MTDLAKTIAPKSDQLNADDLIAGPITITITAVRGCDDGDQPVAIHFEGDNKKPYKPCKSMRRVMVHCWGPDGNTYAGRRMTLYRDEKVMFGGIQVGGIRISHLSHIDREVTMALTATRAKRTPYTVKPLRAEVLQRPAAQSVPAPDLSLDDDAPTSASGLEDWDAPAYAQGQRDNADRIDDEPTLRAWWAELAQTEDFKRLLAVNQGEALAVKGHVLKRIKSLQAQS